MKHYTIVRSECDEQHARYRYAVKQIVQDGGQGRLAMVNVSGVKGHSDPLRNIRNVELVVDGDGEVTAINVDGDCVVQRNSTLATYGE